MTDSVLPDSRARKGSTILMGPAGAWVPVFCANCGADGGMVPEANMTFAFYLCQACAETYGAIAGTMMMPDQVFWERLKQEQLEAHGRFLTEQELVTIVEADSTPLAKLVKEGPGR